MAFANVAGRAGFVLDLDKSALDSGLPEAERQFSRSVDRMEADSKRLSTGGPGGGPPGNPPPVPPTTLRSLTEAAGGMAGLAAKTTLYGLAVSTAYQAHQRLEEALKVTGEEAFTTEGRLRNMGSALMNTDIIGAFEAWKAQPKTLEELGISALEAGNRIEALTVVAQGQEKAIERFQASGMSWKEANKAWSESVDEAGTKNKELAAQLVQNEATLRASENATDALADANLRLGQSFVTAAGQAATFKGMGPNDRGGMQGPGGVAQGNIDAAAAAAGTGNYVSRDARIRAALTTATASGDLDTVLALRKEDERRITKRLRDASNEEKAALTQELANAKAARISAEKAIDAANEQAARERKQKRDDRLAKAAREYREGLDTREQNLRNAYEAAQATPGMRDDRRTFANLKNFLAAEARDQRLDEGERADYRGELGSLKRQWKEDIKTAKEAADERLRARDQHEIEMAKNKVKAAEVTLKRKDDDLKALRELRDKLRRKARDEKGIYTDIEQDRFRGDAHDTQKKINELLTGKTDGSGFDQGAFARNLLAAQQQVWTGMLSQFLGGTGAGNAMQTHALEQFTLQGNRQRDEQTAYLRTIANRGGRRDLDEAVLG